MAQKVADPCRNCGAAIPPGAAFCTLCGTTVTNRAATPAPSSVPLGGPGGSPFAGGHGSAQGNANAALAPTITPGLAPGGSTRDGRPSNEWGGQTPNSQSSAVPGIIPVGMGTTAPLVAPQRVGVDPRIAAATALSVGGAGRRLAAKIIDGVLPGILIGVAAGIGALKIKTTQVGEFVQLDLTWLLILTGIASLLSVGYGIWLWLWEARAGKTPGNVMLGLRTTNMEGRPAGLLAIFLRYLIIAVSGIIPTIGPLLVIISNAWDANDKKQGWHDKVAHTLVFNVKTGRDPLETGGIAERESFVPAAVPTISEVRSPLARQATSPAAAPAFSGGQSTAPADAPADAEAPAPAVAAADTPTRGGRRKRKKDAAVDPFAPPAVQFGNQPNQQNQQNQQNQSQWGQQNPQSQNQQFPNQQFQNQPGQQDQGQQFPGQQEQQFQNRQFPGQQGQGQGQQGQPQQGWQPQGQATQQDSPFASSSAPQNRMPVDQGPITSVPGAIRNTQPEPHGQQPAQAQGPQFGQSQQQQNSVSGPNTAQPAPPAQTGQPAFSAPPPAPPAAQQAARAASQSTARPAASQPPAASPGEDAGETRVRPVAQNPALRLTFDDGRSEDISTVALIGRNPAGYDGEMISRLISIQDSSRSVSKTHLHLRVGGEGLWVTDRNSTNGSAVTNTAGATTTLTGGSPALAEVGSKVHFGDRSFVVGRA